MTTGFTQQTSQVDPNEARRKKTTFRVGLGTGIIFIVISIASTISTLQTGLNAFSGITVTTIVAILGFYTAYLSRHGKALQGSAILVTAILLVSLPLPLLAHGQGLSLAVLIALVVSSIASSTLPSPWASRATIAGIIVGLIVILTDLFLPDVGIPNDPRVTNVITIFAGLIYTGVILYRFNTYSLRTKLIIAFILVTVAPLSVLGYVNNDAMRTILTQKSRQDLNKLTTDAATRLDDYMATQLDGIRTEAQSPSLSSYLQLPLDKREGSLQEADALRTLETFSRKDSIFILSYAILDINGKNRLDTIQSQIGQDERGLGYFKPPVENGVPFASGLIFKSASPTIYFSAPIRSKNGSIIGVLRAEYNALVCQYLITNSFKQEQAKQLVVVDRQTYLRIAYTGNREYLYKSFQEFSVQQLTSLQAEFKMPPGTPNEISQVSPGFVEGVENFVRGGDFLFFTAPSSSLEEDAITTGSFMSHQPWVVVARQAVSAIYAPAEEQAKNNILSALGLTGLATLMAVFVSQVISRPFSTLAQTAEKVAKGDLTVQAIVTSDDEVGRLAQTFNLMTAQLRQTLTNLEQRVEERTTELQTTSSENEERARQLQSIAEISKIVTKEINISKLLPLITHAIYESFGYYHAGIFLVDESQRFAALHAANSAGGQKMLEKGYKLEIGTNSVVGYVVLSGKARIAINTGEEAVFFNNPNLPETRSEMALPLTVRGTTIGALDIQSKETAAFKESDVNILAILADQIAIAIENARLIQQSQSALADSQAIFRSYLRQEWSALMEQKKNAGYQHSTTGGHVLEMPLATDDIDLVIRRGNMVKREKPGKSNENSTLALPIKLSDEVIGVIRVQSPMAGHVWNIDEINLVRAISERVGLALENARLIESSQRRATKERVISDISAKISSAADMNNILETAVQELGRTLSGSDVVIQFIQEQDSR